MGKHRDGLGPHYYRNLDGGSNPHHLQPDPIPMRKLAEMVESLNYGTHRFFSHLIDVRRENLAARIKKYQDQGDHDLAESIRREGDKVADELEYLLDKGYF